MNQKEILDFLATQNDPNYNLLKLAEECTELSDVLIKSVTKPNVDRNEHLIEELGDVLLRATIVIRMIKADDKVDDRMLYKIDNLNKLIEENNYQNY